MINVENVTKRFSLRQREGTSSVRALLRRIGGKPVAQYHQALSGVSVHVPRGSSLAIVGVNGCGKTTLLKLISGVTQPTSGSIRVNGMTAGVVELGEGFHNDLTGIENVFLNATLLGLSREETHSRLSTILDFAELGTFVHAPVRQYSWGMMLRLAFAIAVHTDPEILLIDEALAVGDGYFQWKCLQKMAELREKGCTLLFVTHVPELAEALCENALWLHDGKVRELGPTHQIVTNYSRYVLRDAFDTAPTGLWRTDLFSFVGQGRLGTGQLLLEHIRLLNRKGEATRVFASRESVMLELTVTAAHPVQQVGVAIGIEKVGQGVAMIISSISGGIFDIPEGTTTLRATIPELALHQGSYYMSVSLLDAVDVDQVYDSHLKMHSFMVTEARSSIGYSTRSLYLPAVIHWEPAATAAGQ